MVEYTYLCHQCGNVFRVPVDDTSPPGKEPKCPQCESSQVRELPSWVPLGSDLAEIPSEWEYECQQCKNKFKLPVPGSPSQERNIRCPDCDSAHIHRLTRTGFEPLYCG
jgi:DNA-directed RNA polymerase subunit RPC12/RpoP